MKKKLQKKLKLYDFWRKLFDSKILVDSLILLSLISVTMTYCYNIFTKMSFFEYVILPILINGSALVASVTTLKLVAYLFEAKGEKINNKLHRLDNREQKLIPKKEISKSQKPEKVKAKTNLKTRAVSHPKRLETKKENNSASQVSLVKANPKLIEAIFRSSKKYHIYKEELEVEWYQYLKNTIVDEQSENFIKGLLYLMIESLDPNKISKVISIVANRKDANDVITLLIHFSPNGNLIQKEWNNLNFQIILNMTQSLKLHR